MTEEIVVLGDLYERASDKLGGAIFSYYAGGAGDEITLRANELAWRQLALRQRVLVGVSNRDPSITLLGKHLNIPIVVSPMAWQQLAHSDGEIGMARATGSVGGIYCLSTFSTIQLEEVAESVSDPSMIWMQTQFFQDRNLTFEIASRAKKSGFSAIVLTVDQPVLGRRDRSMSQSFVRPTSPNVGNRLTIPAPDLTWADVAVFVSEVGLPVLLKGVLDPRDVVLAEKSGCAGVIVSNHGGRQLDTVLPSAMALPSIAEVAGNNFVVIVDGGIRRGTDIVKGLALGANAVMIGRQLLWALAVGGEKGVADALSIFAAEFNIALGVIGVNSVSELSPDLVMSVPSVFR